MRIVDQLVLVMLTLVNEGTYKCNLIIGIEMNYEAPVLTLCTSSKQDTIYSNASHNGLGCVLMQD